MNLHLVLFFTRGVSLRTWAMMGMLEREIAIYLRLIANGFRVTFVTYGNAGDLEYATHVGGIEIVCNERDLPLEEYESGLSSLHERSLLDCSLIKTNQIYGAELALAIARFYKKPFVARCGYMWSKNAGLEKGYDSPEATHARSVEEKVFAAANQVMVTTEAMQRDIATRIPAVSPRVAVVPNYVDTDVFRPGISTRDEKTLLFVGRISPEKNLQSLLEAILPLQVNLILIGEGRLRSELQTRFGALDGRVTWEGNVPNAQLPHYMNEATAFVLPSLYEGHPKALLEAMACGTPVLGADSSGIRELIRHGDNGLLCGPDPAALRLGIRELLSRPDLRFTLGRNARKFVLDHYSLDKIAAIEMELLRKVADQPWDLRC
ncbi:MAG TPA: glycosyltransferase family 4 protein [Desulfomonilaceae bacterium]|nr:glycosyltransferase family 4 protein [Desulfomonilaceae bacterium]